jgi:hypothetical protein
MSETTNSCPLITEKEVLVLLLKCRLYIYVDDTKIMDFIGFSMEFEDL